MLRCVKKFSRKARRTVSKAKTGPDEQLKQLKRGKRIGKSSPCFGNTETKRREIGKTARERFN